LPVVVKSIQELSAEKDKEINELKERIFNLEKLVNKLRRIKIFLNQEFFKLGKVNYRNYTDNSNDNLIIDLKVSIPKVLLP
jgi:hypothetical protein